MLATLEKTLLALPRNTTLLWRSYSYSHSSSAPRRRWKSNTNTKNQLMNTVKPAHVVDFQKRQATREQEQLKAELDQYTREVHEDIEQYGDDALGEPNFKDLSNTYDEYMEENARLKDRIKSYKMAKKHFRDISPMETSLLTWAEKENIRYLLETDPDNWTPEAISQAYPISPQGVTKLIKSKLKMRRAKDVKAHDEAVADKIRRIKSGKTPMTEELAKRLKIRDLIPIKVGDLGMNTEEFIDFKPKTVGEFAKLVAPPSLLKEKAAEADKNPAAAKYITDGSFYKDESEIPKTGLKQGLTEDDLWKIMRPSQRMTFAEFESKMERSNAGSLSADMKYMLDLNKVNSSSTSTLPNDMQSQSNPGNLEASTENRGYDPDYPSEKSGIQKYKSRDEAEVVSLTVEGQENYLYHPDSGYEKPYKSNKSVIEEKIAIPGKLRKPNGIYKQGDCYYDENGEFLYRVL